jgi:hypothetical protein
MVEFAIVSNTKIHIDKVHASLQEKNQRQFKLYRLNPDDGKYARRTTRS